MLPPPPPQHAVFYGRHRVLDPLVMLSAVEYGRCEALDPWKNIFLRLFMAAAGDSSLLIAETADVYDRRSGVIVKKGLIHYYNYPRSTVQRITGARLRLYHFTIHNTLRM